MSFSWIFYDIIFILTELNMDEKLPQTKRKHEERRYDNNSA